MGGLQFANRFNLREHILQIKQDFFVLKAQFGISHLHKLSRTLIVSISLLRCGMISAIYFYGKIQLIAEEINYVITNDMLSAELMVKSLSSKRLP